jgi:hypothetical protein
MSHFCCQTEIWFDYVRDRFFFVYVDLMGEFLSQVAASTNKEIESQIPNYPNLPPQLICQLHNVTMHVSMEIWSTFFNSK